MLQTYTLETYKSDIEKIIQSSEAEPVLIENKGGISYLMLPFSPDKIQDVFLMMYQTFSELSKQKQTKSEQRKKMDINKFSFMQSIEATKDFDGSFSDTLIQERRSEL